MCFAWGVIGFPIVPIGFPRADVSEVPAGEKNMQGTRRRSTAVYESRMVCKNGLPLTLQLHGSGLTPASAAALAESRATPGGAAEVAGPAAVADS